MLSSGASLDQIIVIQVFGPKMKSFSLSLSWHWLASMDVMDKAGSPQRSGTRGESVTSSA
jgi:hypothetical protein